MSDSSHHGSAGAPAQTPQSHPTAAAQSGAAGGPRPSAAELDAREREMAKPRRPAGPPLKGPAGAAPAAQSPPPDPSTATDP
jgi:hypothetical protein